MVNRDFLAFDMVISDVLIVCLLIRDTVQSIVQYVCAC
jgi:hypothetical protein